MHMVNEPLKKLPSIAIPSEGDRFLIFFSFSKADCFDIHLYELFSTKKVKAL